MRVHVLGSGAGGGVPQWNCGCSNCRAVRRGEPDIVSRTQSSICVSVDGERWALFNASPDVRTQVLGFPPLAPPVGRLRGTGISSIVLTNADIDHAAGLLVLREGGLPPLYTTERVRLALTEGLSILPALAAYGPVDWRRIDFDLPFHLRDRAGEPIGLSVLAFPVASKAPPYMPAVAGPSTDREGDTVGLLIAPSEGEGGTLAYVPGVRELDESLYECLRRADVVLIDGTFLTEDELSAPGMSTKTAQVMGHAPLEGSGGIVAFLKRLPAARKILIHINNTNPALIENGPARQRLASAYVDVAFDGMDIAL